MARIRKMQRLMEKIAYISVGADVLIAASTYLVIKNVAFSGSLLLLSDYLDFVLVAMIAVVFITLFMLKFSLDWDKKVKMFMFRVTHWKKMSGKSFARDRRFGRPIRNYLARLYTGIWASIS